jgi:hypothetical protein
MVRVAPEACYNYRALVGSVYNAGLHSQWRVMSDGRRDSICPFLSLTYSTNLLLSIQRPSICMVRHPSILHDGRTSSTVLLRHTTVHDERQCALSCDTSLLFLLDVP